MGASLLSPCNRILKLQPSYVYLNRNKRVLTSIEGCRTLLRESTQEPTRCRELIPGWPDYIGFVDASGHGAGGVVIGELSPCVPTIFRWQWPSDITQDIKTTENPGGHISNSDLEMAGLVLLWLTMEEVCGPLEEKRLTLFNDNSPTIGRATKLASGGAPRPGTRPTCKTTKSVPIHADSHCWEAHGHCRHTVALVWKQPCVAVRQ